MATYFNDQWSSKPEHHGFKNVRRSPDDYGTRHDDKHVKAFVGVVLFMLLGFILAGLHPKTHQQAESPAMSAQVADHGAFTKHTN